MANVIDYVELAVDDLEQARNFYAKALGWTFNDYGGQYAGIQDPRNPGQEVGGLNPRSVASRGEGVMALVHTADADAALASVQDAGGRITAELHEYPGGRRFMFADPGATSSASTNRPSRRAPAQPRPAAVAGA